MQGGQSSRRVRASGCAHPAVHICVQPACSRQERAPARAPAAARGARRARAGTRGPAAPCRAPRGRGRPPWRAAPWWPRWGRPGRRRRRSRACSCPGRTWGLAVLGVCRGVGARASVAGGRGRCHAFSTTRMQSPRHTSRRRWRWPWRCGGAPRRAPAQQRWRRSRASCRAGWGGGARRRGGRGTASHVRSGSHAHSSMRACHYSNAGADGMR